MYIDLIIVIVLLLVVLIFFRRFSSFVYSVAILDIFLRIVTFIKNNVPIPELRTLIGTYCPESISSIIGKYSNGIFYTILMWGFVFIYICFLCYTIKVFIRKKK
ncbi:MAG: hypothetical protein J6A52_02310 [Bacilli bacterium]|nr:hypothetical protein [Bacilli bacterium]